MHVYASLENVDSFGTHVCARQLPVWGWAECGDESSGVQRHVLGKPTVVPITLVLHPSLFPPSPHTNTHMITHTHSHTHTHTHTYAHTHTCTRTYRYTYTRTFSLTAERVPPVTSLRDTVR
jgi:hypothetical protein